ncbi:MAG: hypothetical protein IKT57_05880 [Clostridia bacterium]|nr:hypothetical protein [Clostridia bacterium]
MATTTTNLKLTKPAASDAADISVLNANFDKIDALGGYGLGGSAVSVNDLNTALNCGFFCWGSDCLNAPFGYGMGITLNRFNGRYTQLLFNPWMGSFGEIAVRHYNGTEWLPVEWVNPPMSLGVEYRTTERWQGKAVYTKLVDCGQVTDGKTVYYSVDGMTRLIRHAAKITTATFGDINLPYIYGDMGSSYTAYCYVNAASCGFKVGANATGQGYLQIWYTKD